METIATAVACRAPWPPCLRAPVMVVLVMVVAPVAPVTPRPRADRRPGASDPPRLEAQ
jgi:hypothetical protein